MFERRCQEARKLPSGSADFVTLLVSDLEASYNFNKDMLALPEPTTLLLADHEWPRGLPKEYRPIVRCSERLADVHAAMRELKPKLEPHIRREEEAYFPAMEEFMQESGQGSTFDMYGEHDAIKIRLEQLLIALNRQSSAADAYAAFSRPLLIHFENEEELIFAGAPQHLTEEAR